MTDEELRALLGEARVEGPMPPEVVDRIDAVLADLAAERPRPEVTDPVPTQVADLADARRRRSVRTWWGAAAAAVVVVAAGVTLPQVLGGADQMTTSADDVAGDAARDPAAGLDESALPQAVLPEAVAPGPVTLTRAELRDQVVRHLQTVELSDSADGTEGDLRAGTRSEAAPSPPSPRSPEADAAAPCRWTGPGELRAATLDGEPATLVVTSGRGGRQVVRIVTCTTGDSVVAERLVLGPER